MTTEKTPIYQFSFLGDLGKFNHGVLLWRVKGKQAPCSYAFTDLSYLCKSDGIGTNQNVHHSS